MEGRGGCCIARCTSGAHASPHDTLNMDQIMLKFRPIAPKPTVNGVFTASDSHSKVVPGGRGRRRNTNKSSSNRRRKKKSSSPDDHQTGAVTLPLLPEAPDLSPTNQPGENEKSSTWLNFNNSAYPTVLVPPPQQEVVSSFVIVEGITDTWTDNILPINMMNMLENDTCPGFISDAWNQVLWTNEAYRRMVMGDTWRDLRLVVSVVMKESIPETLLAFTCRVRVQRSSDRKQCRGSSLTLPCDVWRINDGGFAWRLDVEAALSLGR